MDHAAVRRIRRRPRSPTGGSRQLIAAGATGLSVAFDLPTQMGYDSDAAIAHGEVGKVGVAIDSLEDMRVLFDGIPLGEVSTSMTINAPAAVLLAALPAGRLRSRAAARGTLTGTIQNDVLKEYIARGTYIYPPRPSLRLVADSFAYCHKELPQLEHHLHLRLPHGRGRRHAGAGDRLHAGQRAASTCGPRWPRAWPSTSSRRGCRSSSWPARRCWRRWRSSARRAGCGPGSCGRSSAPPTRESQMLRFHTQTAGVQLTAQQPEVNVVRVAVQALAAALGGTQSLHTNSFDEAIALPSQQAARLALRTQQVLANETDLTATVDPFAGSYARRVHDQRRRGRRHRADDDHRGHGRRPCRHRARLPEGRDRARRLRRDPGDRLGRAGRRRGEQVRRPTTRSPTSCCP